MKRFALILLSCLAAASAWAQPAFTPLGEVHIPVIPVAFSDVAFSFDDIGPRLEAMLNEQGYSQDGANGSVKDYYTDNSNGRFTPVFDVLPAVTLDKTLSYYGGNAGLKGDRAPELALHDACLLLDGDIDFSVYDSDGDGILDLVIYCYAGYNEADHGPAEAIWSKHADAQESTNKMVQNAVFDGKKLGRYVCSSELSGNTGTVFASIGTICHEFGHALGLPDFYDTDGAQGGVAGGMYDFALMGMGLYNDSGKTPPYLNALERRMLGWIEEIPEIPEGRITVGPVQEDEAYMIPTSTEGEYFIVEARYGEGWDAPLPKGLLVYHIDASERTVGNMPASQMWNEWMVYNNLNASAEHPCAYIVPSSDRFSTNFTGSHEGVPFPGISGCVFLDMKDWDGAETDYHISDISVGAEGVSARIIKGHGSIITGKVSGNDGLPVQGVIVSSDAAEIVSVTDREGSFLLDLPEDTRDIPFKVSATREGYRKAVEYGVLDGRSAYLPIVLYRNGETSVVELKKYDQSATKIFYPLPARDYGDCMGAVRWSASELFPYVGSRLEKVVFDNYVQGGDAEALYVIVDIGTERALTKEVEVPVYGLLAENVVDLSDEDIRIPDGADVYVGYGVKGSGYVYPLAATLTGHADNSYYGKLNLEASEWQEMYTERSRTGYMDLILSAGIREVPENQDIGRMGYATISIDGQKTDGSVVSLSLKKGSLEPLSVRWLYDGQVLENPSVTLSKGVHTVVAKVEYSLGRNENLKLKINIE